MNYCKVAQEVITHAVYDVSKQSEISYFITVML